MSRANQIPVARGLNLPLDAVTQTLGFIARKGAGKTYAAGVLVEGMLEAGAQVVVLDPVGTWYGLRLGADRKQPGFEIPVLGGSHGDIPLEASAGALVADVIIEKRTSAVLDLSLFRKNARKEFVTAFAEQLFHRKKTDRTPVHIVFEEAQVFAPQRTDRGEERMLGAIEDIVRLGRNFGIGASLISQRPQSVHKDVLNQVECLFVLQVNGAHERKAIESWVVDKGIDVKDMVQQLPSLPVGTAFVWSPQWLQVLGRYAIRKKRTFDASATPDFKTKAGGHEPVALAGKDLEALRTAMAEVVEKAEASDPRILQKRIRELEATVRRLEKGAVAPAPSPPAPREVPVLEEAQIKRLETMASQLQAMAEKIEVRGMYFGELGRDIMKALGLAAAAHGGAPGRTTVVHTGRGEVSPPAGSARARVAGRPRTATGGGRALKRGALRMLQALATLHPKALTRHQMATLAGISPKSGTFTSYLSDIRGQGFIHENGQGMTITDAGIKYLAGDWPSAPASTEDLVSMWSTRLKAGARRMLTTLVDAHPRGLARAELGDRAGIEPSSGTFTSYLSDLRRNGLIQEEDGQVAAADTLFIGGTR